MNTCVGLVEPTAVDWKLWLAGVIDSRVPVPLSVDETDPPGVAETCSVADLAPTESGANRTVSVQVAPPASVWLLQLSVGIEYCDASAPLSAVLSAPDVACPVFVIVKTCSALLPAATVPNGWVAGEIASAAGVTPVPLSWEPTVPPGAAET